MEALKRLYWAVRGVCITLPWLAHLLLADLCLSALLPFSALFPVLTYDIASKLAEGVWRQVQWIFTRFNGARITVSGSPLPQGESAIVVSNHVSWTDFYMLQAVALQKGMLGRCRYLAKAQLRWVPLLGWGLKAMGMPLISRNWMNDQRELDKVFGSIITYKKPIWLVSFSEGSRFSRSRYTDAVEWCKARDKPVPQHTLYPRTKGFIATVSELRQASHVKAVYDCTIAYAQGSNFLSAPSFWESLSTPRLSSWYSCHINVQRHPIETLPSSSQELSEWLEARWQQKGQRLELLRKKLMSKGRWDDNEID